MIRTLYRLVTGATQREHDQRVREIDAQIAECRELLDAADRELKDVRCFVNEFIVPTDTEVGP